MKKMQNKKKRRLIKPSRLIFLIVLISANTFAWFIYATKIDSSVSVHVRAWNVVFEAGDNEVSNIININIDSIYPGMEDYQYEVKAYNRSEVSASLTYQVLSATLLGTEYKTVEYKQMLGEQVLQTDPTSASLEMALADNYPFSIFVQTSNNTIALGNGVETYRLNVVWPFESNHDDIDTLWGSNAYTYKESHPNSPSITLLIKITITQNPN